MDWCLYGKDLCHERLRTFTILAKRLILGAWLSQGSATEEGYITVFKIQTKICM